MANAAEWNGPVGQAWATQWQRTDRAFAPLTRKIEAALEAVAPGAGRAFDIGCGAGETAIMLSALRPGLSVIGADVSDQLIETARQRARGIANLSFIAGGAIASAATAGPIDLFLSRHGVMFFDHPVAAFTTFRAAAAPRARLIFTCFRDWSLNRFASDIDEMLGHGPPPPGQPGPFAFAEEPHVRDLLAQSGWRHARAEAVDFDYQAGEGDNPVADAIAYLTRIGPAARALRDAPEADRPRIMEALTACCAARRAGNVVSFPAAAWLWIAEA